MGKRGIQRGKVTVLSTKNVKRPLPPVGMTEKSRIVWKRVTGGLPADYFKPHQYDILRMFCECAGINKVALAKAAKDEYVDPYWVNLSDKMAARCQGLATKLGITVNSTMAARGKGGEAPKGKSKREGLLYGGRK